MDVKSVISNIVIFAITYLAVSQISHYFFDKKSGQEQAVGSGQKMVAPRAVVQTPELHTPLNTEIDFLDKKIDRPEVTTWIETPLMKIAFSNDGAMVTDLTFKRIQASVAHNLNTFVLENPETQREQGGFLVAFNERTPFYYDLVENKEDDDAHVLTYKVKTQDASVAKHFKIYKNKHQIDLNLSIEADEKVQPRIFVPAPLLTGAKVDDSIRALMNNSKNQGQKETVDQKLAENFWASPTLFGAEDRYFIHAVVQDPNNFSMRGFYKLEGKGLSTIIEGQPIKPKEQSSWLLSFYMGPKEIDAFNAVDQRLDATLDYGLWAPISKVLLTIMKFVYDYIPNYGFVIILLTLLIKLLMLPFSFNQSAAQKSRKELDRKIAYLESKYKNDREALVREKAEAIKKHGMSGMLGCIPVLVQIPLFIGLNRVLNNSIELFQAPFLWIRDLSSADPFYILPLLVAIGMIISLAAVGDARQRLPFVLAALIFGAISANFAAGLSLFIATSTWLSIAETRLKKVVKA